MKNLVDKYGCNAGAIQCWTALQGELGIMPCAANAILNDMGIPVVCETDIHGAITALLAEAAVMNRSRGFFADWTVRHPDNPMESYYSTVVHGHSLLLKRSLNLPAQLLSLMKVLYQLRQNQETNLP